MKYENVLSVEETLQNMKVEHVNNKDNNTHVSQKLQTHLAHCTCKSKNEV